MHIKKRMTTTCKVFVVLIILFGLASFTFLFENMIFARAQASYDPTAQTQALRYTEARTVYLGNLARRDNGVPPLRWNRQLTFAARWFSWDSTENRPVGFCGHQDTQGNWPNDRALTFGYLGSAGAENAFCGYVSPEDAIQGWMNSSGHRLNLLDPNSREIGLGYYHRASDGRGYVTQDFGNDAVYAPVVINYEAISTISPDVDLYIYDRLTQGGFAGLDSATHMMVSNTADFNGASWESYKADKAWTLASGDGWKKVYVKTRDKFNRSLTVSDAIYLGANVPLNQLGTPQMSTTRSKVRLINLNGNGLPKVQFSLGWLADDTYGTFQKLWGNGEQINDSAAWGNTAYRLYPGDGESFAWVYDTTFIQNTPLVAYFRLKVNDNTSASEVARIAIQGGSTEYSPHSLRGTDFTTSDQYQEFALNFTFTPTSTDPFLIFKFWRSGSADVFVDAVSIFSAPQPITVPLIWSVPGKNYRGQGIWARYTDGSQFSGITEADVAPANDTIKKTFKSTDAQDGWVLESTENSNKGGSKNSQGKVLYIGDNADNKQYRVILSFNTANIPDTAVITRVVLQIKKAGVIGVNPMTTHNGLAVDIKKNKFYTLPALQINDFQAKPGKYKIGKFPKTPYAGWYKAVLYKGSHLYINKKGLTQFRLRFNQDDDNDNVADILKLYSGNAILANRPKLIMGYYVP